MISLICAAICLSVSFTVYLYFQEIQSPPLPVLGQIKHFVLIDSDGNEFVSHKLRGKVWIADFFFTTCGNLCPIMSKHMARLNRTIKLIDGIRLVSITVNPEYDSAKVLDQYAEKYREDKEKWYFLTGSREKIKDLAVNNFKLGSIDEPVFHSSSFPLVDQNGYIRGYYDGTNSDEVNQLFKDAVKLLKKR